MSLSPSPNAVGSPIGMGQMSSLWQLVFVICGTLFLALSSYIEVPMIPVPVTMQTFAVTLIGALFGWRLGVATNRRLAWSGGAWPPRAGGWCGGRPSFHRPHRRLPLCFCTGRCADGLARGTWLERPSLRSCLCRDAGRQRTVPGCRGGVAGGSDRRWTRNHQWRHTLRRRWRAESALGAMVLYWVAQRVKRAPGP